MRVSHASRPSTLHPVCGNPLIPAPCRQFHGWSGCNGELRGCLSTTDLLNNLNFYWLSGSTTSSLRLYKESLTSSRVWASLFSQVPRGGVGQRGCVALEGVL
jgi:hypothetical protein